MPKAPSRPFRCELCQKSYARISELESHESSYDHHHRKRAVDLRIANRDTSKRDREREKERESSGLVSKALDEVEGSKKKKVKKGFKSAFGSVESTEKLPMVTNPDEALKQEIAVHPTSKPLE